MKKQITSKKVAIISINAHTKVLNFASPLHSYAFQRFLTDNGINSVIVDYKPCYYNKFDARHPYDYWLAHPKKNKKTQEDTLSLWKELYDAREKRFDRFQEFIDKYYVTTDKCYNQELLDTEDIGCDVYMCVTDVIWKYDVDFGFDRGFFLACDSMKGKTKIAYAASRGAKKYDEEQSQKAIEYINDIDYVSCREKSLFDFVKMNTTKKPKMVLDPVFLQNRAFYENLAIKPQEENYVLIYTVMEDAHTLVDEALKFAAREGLKVIDISEDRTITYRSPFGERQAVYDIGVEEWLGYIQNASYIFTNSFHCCCFSLIFNKVFFVGKRAGDKVYCLLKTFHLRRRIISRVDGIYSDINYPAKTIDFTLANVLIRIYRRKSKNWILKTLKKAGT